MTDDWPIDLTKPNPLYRDREGRPISVLEMEELLCDPNYRIVEQTWVADVYVSTIWLPIDGTSFDSDTPNIFETMIFCEDRPEIHLYQQRWRFERSARRAHTKIVAMLRGLLALPATTGEGQ